MWDRRDDKVSEEKKAYRAAADIVWCLSQSTYACDLRATELDFWQN